MEGPQTNQQQIHLDWEELISHEATGGSAITSYNVQWDAGQYGLIWENLVGYEADMTDTEYLVTNQILQSYTYSFQIRAQNKWGWGDWSSVTQVVASTWPEIVDQPTTSIEPTDGSVTIVWTQPDTRGDPITQYLIEFGDAVDNSVWVTYTVECNGQSQTVIEFRTCSVDMSFFISQLRYSLDDPIKARVTAYNLKGQSDEPSPVTVSSAIAKVPPIQMASDSI